MKFTISGNFNIRHKNKLLVFEAGEFETDDKELIEKLDKSKMAKALKKAK